MVRGVINSSADDLGTAGYDVFTGYGRINAARALVTTPPNDPPEVHTDYSVYEAKYGQGISAAVSAVDGDGNLLNLEALNFDTLLPGARFD